MRRQAIDEAQQSCCGGGHGIVTESRKYNIISSGVAPASIIANDEHNNIIPTSTTATATEALAFPSPSSNSNTTIDVIVPAVIPYDNHEININTTPIRSTDSPVVDDDEGVWVGIGCGEAFTLNTSVCSESPLDSYLGKYSNRNNHHRNIPKAIDFQKFESDNLPRVDEDRISNIDSDILLKKPLALVERVGTESVAELSTDLSIMENSIASVVTKEGCIDLAKRFEKMEHILMERAGETSRSDALRALAQATHKQSKRADLLQRKLAKQEKKTNELNQLCQQLMDGMTENKRAQSDMKLQLNDLHRKNAGQRTDLHRYKSQNKELKSKVEEMTEKIRKLEDENNKKSRLLLHRYSEKKANTQLQNEIDELRMESTRRATADRATIDKLQSEMSRMRAIHATKEKKSDRKVQILMEIRSALEEQIGLLEEGGAESGSC